MQIVVMHGIGVHGPDFHQAWESELREQLSGIEFDVVPLRWSELQDKIASRYPLISKNLAELLQMLGVQAGQAFRDSAARKWFEGSIMDVLGYTMLREVRHIVQTGCLAKLLEITGDRAGDTVLLGHSLGAAVLPHIVQLQRRVQKTIPYRAMLLLAPPLGIESPLSLVPDPLAVTPNSRLQTSMSGPLPQLLTSDDRAWLEARTALPRTPGDRLMILQQLCEDWLNVGEDSLHFFANKNDMICSDVALELPTGAVDPVPFKQGYSRRERRIIGALAHFHDVEFGAPRIDSVQSNHDAVTYLQQPAVVATLRSLLTTGGN